eukprot:GHVH01016453.1.p1 GENE.GHVH01016453.1~~GHVH01016453.1.p1  ORF type:complete len:430 (+),score=36.86 GHVH01016453.1:138-1427(+)
MVCLNNLNIYKTISSLGKLDCQKFTQCDNNRSRLSTLDRTKLSVFRQTTVPFISNSKLAIFLNHASLNNAIGQDPSLFTLPELYESYLKKVLFSVSQFMNHKSRHRKSLLHQTKADWPSVNPKSVHTLMYRTQQFLDTYAYTRAVGCSFDPEIECLEEIVKLELSHTIKVCSRMMDALPKDVPSSTNFHGETIPYRLVRAVGTMITDASSAFSSWQSEKLFKPLSEGGVNLSAVGRMRLKFCQTPKILRNCVLRHSSRLSAEPLTHPGILSLRAWIKSHCSSAVARTHTTQDDQKAQLTRLRNLLQVTNVSCVKAIAIRRLKMKSAASPRVAYIDYLQTRALKELMDEVYQGFLHFPVDLGLLVYFLLDRPLDYLTYLSVQKNGTPNLSSATAGPKPHYLASETDRLLESSQTQIDSMLKRVESLLWDC